MITNEEARKAIEKYQKEHPLHLGTMLDVTAISSKEGADIISQTIEKVSKKVNEDTDLWCICEMAKMYMRGVKPVYPVRPQGKWQEYENKLYSGGGYTKCSNCGMRYSWGSYHEVFEFAYCPTCGAEMEVSNDG